jgi:hypothetical protein
MTAPLVSLFAAALAGAAADPAFDRDVKPVFTRHCAACHSAAGKLKAGLDLGTRDGVLRGGAAGPVVVPGNSGQSLLTQVVGPDGSPHIALAKWINALPPATGIGSARTPTTTHWAFAPPIRPAVPAVTAKEWVRGPIDAFILAKLEAKGLRPAPPAAKADLLRRAYYDLTGLPPSPEDVRAFLADDSPGAFETVVDRLLASPAYGERWGRHWLDLARYADSGGFHNDLARPNAWRYRDYVIAGFNADKPFPQFVREQLAGDEIAPGDADALVATGFGRNGPSNDDNMGKSPKDLERYRLDELDGVIGTTFGTFLGLTAGCARCHDHKYDPITQRNYYELLAVFDGTVKKELPFPGEPVEKGKPKNPDRGIMALVDAGAKPRPTRLLWRGDVNSPGPEVAPAVPAALARAALPFPAGTTAGRRVVLADWVASPENPLTYRVLANRVWQHHFGSGLVATPGNFGKSGATPTHPELLDFLALELVANGGRLKPLHKAILLSATYRQSSRHDPAAAALDPENALLWRQNKRRLEAEAVRDGILAVAGTLNPTAGGPGVKPRIRPDLLPASQRNKWPVVAAEGPEHWRRSVYVYAKRQLLFPMLELFDAPTTTDVCDRRTVSVVPTQALLLLNDEFVNDQAKHFADRVRSEAGPDVAKQVERALYLAFGRPPTAARVAEGVAFVKQRGGGAEAFADLCHVLFNCNEFIYLD